ncbi:hypothetical protein [Ferruginibacter albus]|uniref:hypothetical protein n=1 Tax=Ferruginibacter albus TaxID=2875540 RepID=UPI001CC42D1D|nr:hypothetical protein [Ferruginibacter albus]UAY52020.1 hypothetical protein K9M53_15680 [Ferruginibacter albus]
MPNENRSYKLIPIDVINQINSLLTQASQAIAPFLTPLNPDERQSMTKMGDKSVAFVTKANDYNKSDPQFLPAFIVSQDFDIDVNNAVNVTPLANLGHTLANSLADIAMLAGSEAFYAARAYYSNVVLGESHGARNARTIHEELKKRYPGGNRSKAGDVTAGS